MVKTAELSNIISLLRLETMKDSISPERVGYILQRIVDLIDASYSAEETRELLRKLQAELSNDYRNRINRLKDYTDNQIASNTAYIQQVENLFKLIYESDPEQWAFIGEALKELESNWRMEIDCDGGDNFVGYGETKHITCRVYNGYNKDITSTMTAWKIERDTGFPADSEDRNDDDDWNNYKRKVKNFFGEIDLLFVEGDDEDGMPLDDFGYLAHPYILGVTFIITAMRADKMVKARLVM